MEEVGFCNQCRRIVNLQYHFCPWCGAEQKRAEVNLDLTLEESCRKMDQMVQKKQRNSTLDRIERELNYIEEDMQLILSKEKK